MEYLDKDNKFKNLEFEFKNLKRPLQGRRLYIDRLMKVLGRTFWQVNGVANNWSEDMFLDALAHCEQYSNIKLRNLKFNEYVAETRK